ncbi:hypothetical protein KCP78_15190 [Salmonella enterica subsp. enterica]|nr:hypothetical protein KCP78_15190 [Salmonella enterica subsp. enterica]
MLTLCHNDGGKMRSLIVYTLTNVLRYSQPVMAFLAVKLQKPRRELDENKWQIIAGKR